VHKDEQRLLAVLDRPAPRATGTGAARARLGGLALTLAAVAAAAWYWNGRGPEPAPAAPAGRAQPPGSLWGDPRLGTGGGEPAATVPAEAPAAAVAAPAGKGVFRFDADGKLILDGDTRYGIERLLALHDGADLERELQAQLEGVPPAAAAQARQLIERYQSYVDAQKGSYAPGSAPLVPAQGLAELDGLIALRTAYFGEAAARRLFGADEAVARRLLELMRDDPLPNAPMADKAQRAQARLDEEIAQGRFRVGGGS